MKERLRLFGILVLAALFLTACSAKLTTIRPADVYLSMERLTDGAAVGMPDQADHAALGESLVFQLEEPYREVGSCGQGEAHKYRVQLVQVISGRIELECFINEDSSVCKEGRRYLPSDKADQPVNLSNWDAYFESLVEAAGEPDTEPEPEKEPAEVLAPPAAQPEAAYDWPDLPIVASQGAAQPLPDGIDLGLSYPVAEVLPWSYYVGEAVYDGQEYIMVWRDTPEGQGQWLCSLEQPMDDSGLRHDISYDGGAELSGGRYLYFTISDAATFHRSLWLLDTETDYFNCFYAGPCSNLVTPLTAPQDYQGLGWIVYDHYLVPIDLAAGKEYTAGVIDLLDYYQALGEDLFYGIGDFGSHKFVQLSDLGDNVFLIDSITAEPATSAPELRETHQIDYVTLNFY